jgi:phosphoribosylformimino-5-aminoimidazole carboxamide ribotide isomerase
VSRDIAVKTAMRILPVLDLLNGKVVRGLAGNRAAYKPIESQLCSSAEPADVAKALRSLGFDECYVADLDAIAGKQPAHASYAGVAGAGLQKLWIDAGIRNAGQAETLLSDVKSVRTIHRLIAGSETLGDRGDLVRLLAMVGRERLVFSLDLKHGRPLVAAEAWRTAEPLEIAADVIQAGIERIIVLDLANVGVGAGVTTESLCLYMRRKFPYVELIAGGGIRSVDDLHRLADWGCDAALVASALHDGRIRGTDIRVFESQGE